MHKMTKKRGAPVVASRNAEQALSNLHEKKSILAFLLKECTRDASAVEKLKLLPKSIRQFNFWKGEHQWPGKRDVYVKFSPNSNETLRVHVDLREEVQQLVDAVRKLGEVKVLGRREDTMRALRNQIVAERQLTAIANREVVQARFLICELRDSLEEVRHSKKAIIKESQAHACELEAQIQLLGSQIADLRKSIRKERILKSI